MIDLPNLTKKQQNAVERYFKNGRNQTDAYRYAYNTSGLPSTVTKEASKLFRNPEVRAYIAYCEANQAEAIQEEVKYTALQSFNCISDIQDIALENPKKPNLNAALKAEELKMRLGGHWKDITRLEDIDGFSLFAEKTAEKAEKLNDELQGK